MSDPSVPELLSFDVLVVGGGFAGLNAALAAARRSAGRLTVALVAPEPFMTIRPRLYEADPEHLVADIAGPLVAADVVFLEGSCSALEPDKRVRLEDGRRIGYRSLVLATGSQAWLPPVLGVEHAFHIADRAAARRFDERLRAASLGGAPTIVIIGSGFTGLELATELRSRIAGHGGPEAASRARVILVERSGLLGPEIGAEGRAAAEAALDAAGVEVRLKSEVVQVSPAFARFSDGSTIEADAVVFCTGFRASRFVESLRGSRDELGRLIVDRQLRTPDPEIFLAGDVAHAKADRTHVAPQSCQHAIQMGRVAGENAARALRGRPLLTYRQPFYLTCLDLGPWGAFVGLGWARKRRLSGGDAKRVKQWINRTLIYPPPPPHTAAVRTASAPSGLLEQWFSRAMFELGIRRLQHG
jgi:NADH dehydrogenase